jgi:hypothetical protein
LALADQDHVIGRARGLQNIQREVGNRGLNREHRIRSIGF